MCRVLAVTTVYYPDIERVKSNIARYVKNVDTLLVWNNTPEESTSSSLRFDFDASLSSKIVMMSNGRNEGLAYAFNQGMRFAEKNNYDLLLLMDQDSLWENFESYITKVKELYKAGVYGIYVPNVSRQRTLNVASLVEKECFINAGTVFCVKETLPILGDYNERLFVDGCDLDYSIRAKLSGIKILCLCDNYLEQQYGDPVRSVFWKFASNNYSADRTYHIVRNHMRSSIN